MENWNYATAASSGTIARRHPYNYQQSLRAPKASEPLAPGVASFQYTEEMARRFYRRWRDYMKNEGWDVLCPSPSTASNGVRTYRTG